MSGSSGGSDTGGLPEVMSAAVYQSPGSVTVEERPVPRPGPDQLVVRVHACGICGSDIHQLRDGWGFKPGAVAGHEWSGTIAAVGDDVTRWSVGELVVGGASPKCGTCRRCREGKPSQCENRQSMTGEHTDGAFAEYILVREAGVLRLPEGLLPRHAALAEPLSVALHGITRSGVAARRHRHGVRGRADRRPQRRGAAVDGDHGHHRRGAARGPAPPGRQPRRVGRRRPGRPRGVRVLGAGAHVLPRGPRRPGVLGAPGGDRGGLQSAGTRRHPGDGGGRHRPPHVRHQPHDPQRADRHRVLRLRPGRLRTGARVARLRRVPGRSPDRSRRRRARRHQRGARGPRASVASPAR